MTCTFVYIRSPIHLHLPPHRNVVTMFSLLSSKSKKSRKPAATAITTTESERSDHDSVAWGGHSHDGGWEGKGCG